MIINIIENTEVQLDYNALRISPYLDAEVKVLAPIMQDILDLPTVTPNQKIGHWMKGYEWVCSNCGTLNSALYKCCPNCGAEEV